MNTIANRNRKIVYGDKIFARITRNGATIHNLVTEKVSSITDLIMEVRRLLKDIRGLVILHIRNYNAGWGEERPLMLYGSSSEGIAAAPAVTSMHDTMAASGTVSHAPQHTMLFPWEVH